MNQPAHTVRHSFHDYLMLEQASNTKHEFLDGQIVAIAGGTPDHAALAANVVTLLNVQLRGRPCRVFTSDLRVRVLSTGLCTYPDVTVVCGHFEADPEDASTATNPIVLVEVLSPSTAQYDRNEKIEHYQQIASLREVILVDHDQRLVEVRSRASDAREGDHWTTVRAQAGETIRLASIDCELSVDEIYRNELTSTP